MPIDYSDHTDEGYVDVKDLIFIIYSAVNNAAVAEPREVADYSDRLTSGCKV